MDKYKYVTAIAMMLVVMTGCVDEENAEYQFAVLSDTHVQDVNGEFNDVNFKGYDVDGENYTIRPMEEQMVSTRLFNENYYAFEQALNEVADAGIKDVVITGDISDDDQVMNINKVAEILSDYEEEYEMNFFLVPGNHEPSSPTSVDQGDNFLKADGSQIDVKSQLSEECQNKDADVACDSQMSSMSQEDMVDALSEFGYMPEEDDLLWATPYSSYDLADYSYDQAASEASLNKRQFQTCNDNNECEEVADLSYVVEPNEDYLFLCIDGDVYVPNEDGSYEQMGDNGLNYFLEYKMQTLDFIKEVVDYAAENNKQVILFDHYPLADFYAGNSEELKSVFGEDGMDFDRLPNEQISKYISDLGIKLMFSGHMHYNATGIYENGNDTLVNIMTSSTAAYVPSYKVVSSSDGEEYEIETKVLEDVENFDALFPLYEQEIKYELNLSEEEKTEMGITEWNKEILDADNYYEFNRIFIETLVRVRHYPEWGEELHEIFDNLNLYELVVYSQITEDMTPEEFIASNDSSIDKASSEFDSYLVEKDINKEDLEQIEGIELVTAFYKFLSARELAYQDYTDEQIAAFDVAYTYINEKDDSGYNKVYVSDAKAILSSIKAFATDVPSDHFKVNVTTGEVTDLKK